MLIFSEDEISLLEEELIELFVKSLLVVLNDNAALFFVVWMKKSYNLDSFKA